VLTNVSVTVLRKVRAICLPLKLDSKVDLDILAWPGKIAAGIETNFIKLSFNNVDFYKNISGFFAN